MVRSRSLVCTAIVGLVLAACGQNDDPNGAKDLYARITAANYRSWERAPGFPTRKPSFTDHSDAVEIFINSNISDALKGPDRITQWPVGSIIVKESYADNTRNAIAAIEKKDTGWFWTEFDADGKATYSGKPDECISCHNNRQSYSDWVYSFELPR